ncbi:hypothetical protein KNP414_04136 [Paenibacillus mucilaginosus KNP414]|uniref:Uncharacterized protein n=1 Tax=Paenibacillus mucilaginosus (strain KNP414) TaxID=1036673 RepID=F8FFP1_PAEMK|nr:hypothetical protein KNP414_04136 [Paenibacillus mucilaginosus KNP414]
MTFQLSCFQLSKFHPVLWEFFYSTKYSFAMGQGDFWMFYRL